jgi:hypothetical protein
VNRLRPRRPAGCAGEQGSVTIEFMGWMPWLFAITAVVWQLLLYVGAVTNAESAARSAARAASMDEGGSEVAIDAVPNWLTEHTQARRHPDRDCDASGAEEGSVVTVCIQVPIIAPWISSEMLRVERSAEMPD